MNVQVIRLSEKKNNPKGYIPYDSISIMFLREGIGWGAVVSPWPQRDPCGSGLFRILTVDRDLYARDKIVQNSAHTNR